MADSKEKLFSDFAPTTTEQWMEKVTADLKGADFEKKLVWKTNEGFKVKPFYRMEDLEELKTVYSILETTALPLKADGMPTDGNGMYQVKISLYAIAK